MSEQVAIVTGSSRGIGRATAYELARDGYRVVINYIGGENEQEAKEFLTALEAAGYEGLTVEADVSRSDSVQKLVDRTLEAFGRIDVLVNNAGINRDQLMLRITDQEWEELIRTDLSSAFYCSRAVLKPMLRRRYGRIIHISSVVGISGNVGQVHYAAAKSGLLGLSRSIAKEYGGRGITSNVIAPGYIESAMTAGMNPEQTARMLEGIAVKRLGRPEDIAGVAAFLVSSRADYINGQVIQVDGGMSLL